jgi:hypothetical protein
MHKVVVGALVREGRVLLVHRRPNHDPGRFVLMLLTCRKRHTVLALREIGIRL